MHQESSIRKITSNSGTSSPETPESIYEIPHLNAFLQCSFRADCSSFNEVVVQLSFGL